MNYPTTKNAAFLGCTPSIASSRLFTSAACCLLLVLAACGDDDGGEAEGVSLEVETSPTEGAAGVLLEGLVVKTNPNQTVQALVTLGGGSIEAELTADANGTLEVPWTLGLAPVMNELQLSVGDDDAQQVTLRVDGNLEAPIRAEDFADIHNWLVSEDIETSTEDLAIVGDKIYMGAPPGVFTVAPSGEKTWLSLSGDATESPWGMAMDRDGVLWAADAAAGALISISPEGEVTSHFTAAGDEDLLGPNYVAVGPDDGHVYVSDPCSGRVVRYDPGTQAVVGVHTFERTEGGPNGMAFDESGQNLIVITEATGLLCSHSDIPIDEENAGLFSVSVADFEGAHETVVSDFALIGDGIAYDVEGNLYAVIDNQENFQLKESLVVVLPHGETEFRPFLTAAEGHLYANVAFGTDAFGATHLYITKLQLPLFASEDSRGLERIDIGIQGLSLLP